MKILLIIFLHKGLYSYCMNINLFLYVSIKIILILVCTCIFICIFLFLKSVINFLFSFTHYIFIRLKNVDSPFWVYSIFINFVILTKIFVIGIIVISNIPRYSLSILSIILLFRIITMYIFYPIQNKKFSLKFLWLYFVAIISDWFGFFKEIYSWSYDFLFSEFPLLSSCSFTNQDIIVLNIQTNMLEMYYSCKEFCEKRIDLKGDTTKLAFWAEARRSLSETIPICNGNYIIFSRLRGIIPEIYRSNLYNHYQHQDRFQMTLTSNWNIRSWYLSQVYNNIVLKNPDIYNHYMRTLREDFSLGFDTNIPNQHFTIRGNPEVRLDFIEKVQLMIKIAHLRDEYCLNNDVTPTMKDLMELYHRNTNNDKELYKFAMQCQKLFYQEDLATPDKFFQHPEKRDIIMWSIIMPSTMISSLLPLSR